MIISTLVFFITSKVYTGNAAYGDSGNFPCTTIEGLPSNGDMSIILPCQGEHQYITFEKIQEGWWSLIEVEPHLTSKDHKLGWKLPRSLYELNIALCLKRKVK